MKRNLLGILAVIVALATATRVVAIPTACCELDGTCHNFPPCGNCATCEIACAGMICVGPSNCGVKQLCQISDCYCDTLNADCCVAIGGTPTWNCACISQQEQQREQDCPDEEDSVVPFAEPAQKSPVVFWIGLPL